MEMLFRCVENEKWCQFICDHSHHTHFEYFTCNTLHNSTYYNSVYICEYKWYCEAFYSSSEVIENENIDDKILALKRKCDVFQAINSTQFKYNHEIISSKISLVIDFSFISNCIHTHKQESSWWCLKLDSTLRVREHRSNWIRCCLLLTMDGWDGWNECKKRTFHTTKRRKMRHVIKFRFIFMILIVNEQHNLMEQLSGCWNELLIIIYNTKQYYPVQWPNALHAHSTRLDGWLVDWLPSSFTVSTFHITCVFVLWACVCACQRGRESNSSQKPNALSILHTKYP